MDESSPLAGVERRYVVGKELAARLGFSVPHLRALLVARGCKLEKFSERGLRISESELKRFLDDAAQRARAG